MVNVLGYRLNQACHASVFALKNTIDYNMINPYKRQLCLLPSFLGKAYNADRAHAHCLKSKIMEDRHVS
jgi:hypothetical protein